MIINPKRALDEGWLEAKERPLTKKQLQPNGIDLRLKSADRIESIRKPYFGDTESLNAVVQYVPSDRNRSGKLDIFSFDALIAYRIETFEYVRIPAGVAAIIYGRSTWNRNGILARSSVYDSGFKNSVGFVIYPFVSFVAELGVRVAQIVFYEAESTHLYDGTYQDRR